MSPAPRERIQVGIPGFDEIVHGGLSRGRSTLVAGATRTGKTVFGPQFLRGGALQGPINGTGGILAGLTQTLESSNGASVFAP